MCFVCLSSHSQSQPIVKVSTVFCIESITATQIHCAAAAILFVFVVAVLIEPFSSFFNANGVAVLDTSAYYLTNI